MNGLVGFIIFIAICILSSASKKTKGGSTASKPSEEKKAPAAKPASAPPQEKRVFVPKEPTVKTAAPASRAPERRYYDSTCMEANSRHDHDRRMEQLDAFLKDGIIDKVEYKILQQRYQQYR